MVQHSAAEVVAAIIDRAIGTAGDMRPEKTFSDEGRSLR
jgi:hypothetical protein